MVDMVQERPIETEADEQIKHWTYVQCRYKGCHAQIKVPADKRGKPLPEAADNWHMCCYHTLRKLHPEWDGRVGLI